MILGVQGKGKSTPSQKIYPLRFDFERMGMTTYYHLTKVSQRSLPRLRRFILSHRNIYVSVYLNSFSPTHFFLPCALYQWFLLVTRAKLNQLVLFYSPDPLLPFLALRP